MIFEGLDKIEGEKFLGYLFTSLSLLIPGASYLFLTDINLFLKIDTFRLIVLSIFYSLPLFVIMMTMVIKTVDLSKTKDDTITILILTSLAVITGYFFSLLIFYLTNHLFPYIETKYMPFFIYGFAIITYNLMIIMRRAGIIKL